MSEIDPLSGKTLNKMEDLALFPATLFVTPKEKFTSTIWAIQEEMVQRRTQLEEEGKMLEAKRLEERVNYDLEMMRELGYCSGIENYSRFLMVVNRGCVPSVC